MDPVALLTHTEQPATLERLRLAIACNHSMQLFRSVIPFTSARTTTLRRFHAANPRMINGDLNNTTAGRKRIELEVDPSFHAQTFAIAESQDDAEARKKYRPFLLDEETSKSDWISQLELSTTLKMVQDHVITSGQERLRILVLHGSMRNR